MLAQLSYSKWLQFCFFLSSVNVDEWLNQAQMDSLTADENGMQRTPSQMSLRTESSGGVGGASLSQLLG